MLRTAATAAIRPAGARTIVGVAPVLNLAPVKPNMSYAEQKQKNTAIALEMIRRHKGAEPAPYTRRHSATFEEIEREVELLLGGGVAKSRTVVRDDQPMDKLTVMERCLRHAVWQYLKDEGKGDAAQMEKWIVYTEQDEAAFATWKREAELAAKYEKTKAARWAETGANAPAPKLNWAEEYNAVIDREAVAEKRFRYATMQANTVCRDEAEIEALKAAYRKPVQDARLDGLVDMLERFKPMLAREAILQRLTVKHLEGQLGVWRYMDWMPEVRDRAELEADNYAQQWWSEWEEKRLLAIRLRSKAEVKEVMAKKQAEIAAKSETKTVASAGSKADQRAKLLQELLALQSRIKKDDAAAAKA